MKHIKSIKKFLLYFSLVIVCHITNAQSIESRTTDNIKPTDKALYNLSVDIENASRLFQSGVAMSISGGMALSVGVSLIIDGSVKKEYSYNNANGFSKSLTRDGGIEVAFGTLLSVAGIVFTSIGGSRISEGFKITNKCTINTRGLVYKF